MVKGNYEFSDNQVKLTLWVQDSLSKTELIATVIRPLMIQTRAIQQSNEWLLLAITTLPAENVSKLKIIIKRSARDKIAVL
ncbi:hypothetical protein SAMN05660236_0825 [Ohtaekwangia koreensis]|uniref:Uncharacterized protein n=1 Tax=Ohtaekwangia koreensis TaxID=688867 RepID=A0A1T5J6Y7_9BACT|nr:hypothetical protein SAMN05660236_0825 [Ohtaekwangia koreensis]